MGVTTEAIIECLQLVMHHGVERDSPFEIDKFLLAGKLSIEQQIGDFHEAGLFGELLDRIAAMEQDTLAAINIGQAGFATGRRFEARIKGEQARLGIEFTNIDHIRANRARIHAIFMLIAIDREFSAVVTHIFAPAMPPDRRSAPMTPHDRGAKAHRKFPAMSHFRSAPRAGVAQPCPA